MDKKFALLWHEDYYFIDIVEFDDDNEADSPFKGHRGWSWCLIGTFPTREEAEKYRENFDFTCTVMRKSGSSPAYEENYKIVDGEIDYDIVDEEGDVWFPKRVCWDPRYAAEYIESAVEWCRYNGIGYEETDTEQIIEE